MSDTEKQLLIAQISECWADNRNFDAILWQIPTAISAIAGLMANALIVPGPLGGEWVRPLVSGGAAIITVPLVVALVKNRIFQIDRNNWRIGLYRSLLEDDRAPARPMDIAPEVNAPEGLVLFSSPHLRDKVYRGPWYWRLVASNVRTIRAFNVLLAVALLVLASEVALTLFYLITLLAGT